ncbi:MAG: hypothetical protein FE044_01935 [Thermoplasmata archaeon]|nr:MAG: hypothetical protein FE044_01935 [Thermoplasmata archaeon]
MILFIDLKKFPCPAKEAKDIAVALGAKPHTFSMESQCWGNDLWMSCTGKSRNREFGKLIGDGLSPKEALKEMEKSINSWKDIILLELYQYFVKKQELKLPF